MRWASTERRRRATKLGILGAKFGAAPLALLCSHSGIHGYEPPSQQRKHRVAEDPGLRFSTVGLRLAVGLTALDSLADDQDYR